MGAQGDRSISSCEDCTDTDLSGSVIGDRYLIESLIARSRMGRVYKAVHLALRRPVALKVMTAPCADTDQEARERFSRRFALEASTSSRLNHPHIVRVFDYGAMSDGRQYLVMEFLEGQALSEVLAACGRMRPTRVLTIAIQIARGLRKAHSLGVVHRDLKPANIMIAPDEEGGDMVRIVDFGIAKLLLETNAETSVLQRETPGDMHGVPAPPITEAGMLLGSPAYMSPEQSMGAAVDARTDMYSFGVMVYEMLAGRLPFGGASMADVLHAHVHDSVPSLVLPADEVSCFLALKTLAYRCLAKSPDDRFSTTDALVAELKTIWRVEMEESYGPKTSNIDFDPAQIRADVAARAQALATRAPTAQGDAAFVPEPVRASAAVRPSTHLDLEAAGHSSTMVVTRVRQRRAQQTARPNRFLMQLVVLSLCALLVGSVVGALTAWARLRGVCALPLPSSSSSSSLAAQERVAAPAASTERPPEVRAPDGRERDLEPKDQDDNEGEAESAYKANPYD